MSLPRTQWTAACCLLPGAWCPWLSPQGEQQWRAGLEYFVSQSDQGERNTYPIKSDSTIVTSQGHGMGEFAIKITTKHWDKAQNDFVDTDYFVRVPVPHVVLQLL